MKRFWYKFLVCVLSLGMLYPTWIATGAQKAKAASFSQDYYYQDSAASYSENNSSLWTTSGIGTYGNTRYTTSIDTNEFAQWSFSPGASGDYTVSVSWIIWNTQTEDALYVVEDENGANPAVHVNMKLDKDGVLQSNGTLSGLKNIGTYSFEAGGDYNVKLFASDEGHVHGDVVRIEHQNVAPSQVTLSTPSNAGYLNDSEVAFDWSDSADIDDDQSALRYELFVSEVSDFSTHVIKKADASALVVSGYQEDLINDGEYYWYVRAWDGTDYSLGSEVNSFVIDTISPTTKPVIDTPVVDNGTVNLSWSVAGDNVDGSGISYYEIYRQSSPAILVGTTSDTTFSDMPGFGEFTYFVRAYDMAGNYIDSDPTDLIDLGQLSSPKNLVATSEAGEVVLSWDAVVGAVSYNVYYKKASDTTWIGPVGVLLNGTKITGLEDGVEYDFIVQSVDSNGNPSSASAISVTVGSVSEKIVLASAPTVQDAVVAQPETPVVTPEVTPPTEETGPEIGQIKGEETAATEEEDINWTPWIILFVLIVLAGAATGGYFYWFGNEEEEIVSEKVIEKTRKSNGKKSSGSKPSAKKSKRW